MKYDAVVVGGGIAGLTSAAYLSAYGYKVLLCEQREILGGLVNSFSRGGCVFDGGIRAIENSGIVLPMLKQLGIELEFVKNEVSLIIGKRQLLLQKEGFTESYRAFLEGLFPEEGAAIGQLIEKISASMEYMKVLYGFDNPLFMNLKEDAAYAWSLIPWMAQYLVTIGKIEALSQPIDEYLAKFIHNPVLVDMFAQHFFQKTPAFFALSYFSLYLDYQYPVGGTGALVQKLQTFTAAKGGDIRLQCGIQSVNCAENSLIDAQGQQYFYKKLIWAADGKQLYNRLNVASVANKKLKNSLNQKREVLQNKTGSDSIFTVYLTLAADAKALFQYIGPHVFYTPQLKGLSCKELEQAKNHIFQGENMVGTKEDIYHWAKLYLAVNTFEISCPAMRDAALAPAGQAALMVSCLFSYNVMRQVRTLGYYEEFKQFCEEEICRLILEELLSGLECRKVDSFSSSPLTIERVCGNTQGSVTGWGFTNKPVPAVTRMSKIGSSIKTGIPHVYQAGQWTFAPGGLPIAVLTGKLAADKVKKELR